MTFDIAQFETLAHNFYESTSEGDEARNTIMSIGADPSTLLLFHSILHQTTSHEARFLCLNIISSNIQNGWPALMDHQRNLLKGDFFQMIFQWVHEEVPTLLLRQLDLVLVQILIVEWPQGWPSFLHDFIFTSKSTPSAMVNGVYFLGLLSDQVRNSSLLSIRKSELFSALYDNFQMIYAFINHTFSTGNQKIQNEGLIALSEYFQWIDLKLIPTDQICEIILGQLMPNPVFRPAVLRCIISIVSRENIIASPSIIQLFQELITAVSSELSMLEDDELIPMFVEVFSKFVCLDRCALMPNDTVTQWMIEYTKIVDEDLLCDIISMWHSLTKCYIFDAQSLPFSSQFLVPLQYVLCSRMAKPFEFGGNRSFFEECSETLVLLFKMHRAQSLSIIVQKLDVPRFTPDMMPWIYSVGAVSGVCEVEEERSLLTTIFNILLRFSQANDESITSVIASFFYIASQYTRYLKSNLQILDLALRKLVDAFVAKNNQPLQLVAVNAFKKIAIGCGPILVETGYAQRLFEQFNDFLMNIPSEMHLTFFEGITHIVRHCVNQAQKQTMIISLFEKANTVQILTELIPIVNESFKAPLENLMRSIFQQFVNPEISEDDKEALYELFGRFLETFPNTMLLNDFIQLFMNDFTANKSALALNCFAIIVNSGNRDVIPMLYSNILMPTFSLISEDYVNYPDIRQNFFLLVHSFFNFFNFLDTDAITVLLHYTFFGLKHPQPQTSEMSMNCISNVLCQLDKNEDAEFVNGFYQIFYEQLMNELIALLFDGLHSALFSQITHTIGHLLSIAESGKIMVLNQNQIIDVVFRKLRTICPECNEEEVGLVANDIVNSAGNNGKLRQVLSDFVIASRQLQTPGSSNVEDDLLELREISPAPLELEFLKTIADDGSHLVANDSDLAD
ncbi:hypothetical protein TRFO_20522 [Tritrichomonas foetus]|uniref:Exportin-1 C-terminal domain-containing protein n=1 Tax=Tritrichomonas foetus TaxID=1144522 RepID=A0A1J4KFN6_9EUKA|nr:hypothetical protein TRFO_20522 [Tritrichomonas foetus]|eukprot:OHT10225.1 hypothetical protein TRFO_20522 [Tritrichomonas foetus]